MLLVLSTGSLVGAPTTTDATATPIVETVATASPSQKIAVVKSTEDYIREYFADEPIMIQVARCESHFRQFDKDGSIHRGVVNHSDVGVMQINEYYHLDEAKKANYNIYTLEGNAAFARALYEKEGTQPWASSRGCWGKYEDNIAMK